MIQGLPVGERGSMTPPTDLLDSLAGRWQPLVALAVGRVYELPAEGVEAALRTQCSRGARYDTILSFMCTTQVSDMVRFVADLEQILVDDGCILMLEPSSAGNGRSNRLTRRFRSRGHPTADVVSALRTGGFTVTDLHRRELGSAPPRWRRYVEIRARRETPPVS